MTAFVTGVILLYCCPYLPSYFMMALLFIVSVWSFRFNSYRHVALGILGFLYAAINGHAYLNTTLPVKFQNNSTHLTGYLCSLPQISKESIRFLLCVNRQQLPIQPINTLLEKDIAAVHVSYYHPITDFRNPDINTGLDTQKIIDALKDGSVNVQGKLKPLRGLVNFYGPISETSYFTNNLSAKLTAKSITASANTCELRCQYHRTRLKLADKLHRHTEHLRFQPFIKALVLGDRSGITQEQWHALKFTGTSHLLAISGLHIATVSVFVLFVCRLGLRLGCLLFNLNEDAYRRVYRLTLIITLLSACGYGLIAGFGTPVQRSLVMFCVATFAFFIAKLKSTFAVSIALLIVVLLEPKSVLMPGTWLSFAAVFILITLFSGRLGQAGKVMSLVKINIYLTVGMSAVQLFYGLPFAWLSPLVNFIAVPFVTFFILPIALVSFFFVIFDWHGMDLLLALFDLMMSLLWTLVIKVANMEAASAPVMVSAALVLLAVLCIVLLIPLGRYLKWVLISLPVLVIYYYHNPIRSSDSYAFEFMDVGQGLAVLIEAEAKVLYDMGPKYGMHFDAGERVILPALHHKNIDRLNAVIVSHNDSDHRGGFESVSTSILVDSLYGGMPELLSESAAYCAEIPRRISDIQTEVFWHQINEVDSTRSSNNRSCVVKFNVSGVSILIPGDIDSMVEKQLVLKYREQLQADILVAAHHGSQTSSSWAFIKTVNPFAVVFSAGFKNQFGHPSEKVVEKFQKLGVHTYNTADYGAIRLSIQPELDRKKMTEHSKCEKHHFQSRLKTCFNLSFARNERKRFWVSPILVESKNNNKTTSLKNQLFKLFFSTRF